MLDIAGSEWRWEERGVVGSDGRAHFARVRQTLAGGCYRVFAVGDAVILMGRAGVVSTAPADVYLAQILDFYEAFPPAAGGDATATAEGMKVVFRWFYWNATEVPALALRRRDPVSNGDSSAPAPLMEEDFFMSNFVEREQPNSVSTIIGRALLCPSLRELPEYKARLARGRAEARALLAAAASARLPLTESDQVYLCRWYYARADDGPSFPPPGRLIALPHGALSYFLRYPTCDPNGVYPKLLEFRRRARAQVRAARRGDAARGASLSARGKGAAAVKGKSAARAESKPAASEKKQADAAAPAMLSDVTFVPVPAAVPVEKVDAEPAIESAGVPVAAAAPAVAAAHDVRRGQPPLPAENAAGVASAARSTEGSGTGTVASEPGRPRARGTAAELRVAGGGIAKRAQAPKRPGALQQAKALQSKACSAEGAVTDSAAPARVEPAGLLSGLRGTRLDGFLPRMWAAVLRQVQVVAGERGGLDGRAHAVRDGSGTEQGDVED